MKSIFSKTRLFSLAVGVVAAMSLAGCYDDDSNSVLTDITNEYGSNTKIELGWDSIAAKAAGVTYESVLYKGTWSKGDTIRYFTKVKYAYPEHLKYTWLLVPYAGGAVQTYTEGNKSVYYQPDTVSHEKDLNYVVNLSANTYQLFLVAEDTITGLSQNLKFSSSYQGFTVAAEGIQSGMYLLCETADGNTDLEVYGSSLMLIYGSFQKTKYYSSLNGTTIPGKPLFIRAATEGGTSKRSYMVFTDKNMYRLNRAGLATMNTWDNSFYEKPSKYNPQNFFFTNSCEFLINDGKLYTLYTSKANSRKFSASIAGDKNDYTADDFLLFNTKASWRPVTGAIGSDMVIFDKQNLRFIPYYSQKSSMSSFTTTAADAYLDANKLLAQPKVILNGYNNVTYAIIPFGGTNYLCRYNFYNRVDEGDLSYGGDRSRIDLSGCEDLDNAKYWASNTSGDAFYYSSGKNVYSFAPTSGKTKSETVYTCESGEEVTCIYCWGSVGGGWPTASCILWIATWNENTKTSKLIQYEMDHGSGLPNAMYGPMFGSPDNPTITTGWQKIVGMVSLDAQ